MFATFSDVTIPQELVIVGKEAEQSSDYNPNFSADKAVDGNSDSDLNGGGSCTHTRKFEYQDTTIEPFLSASMFV